jgi:hypothetical protein
VSGLVCTVLFSVEVAVLAFAIRCVRCVQMVHSQIMAGCLAA